VETFADFADRLELFFGEGHDTIAHVYARLRGRTTAEGFQLAGRLTGPTCLYAETLPATFKFVDRGPGNSLVAVAIVPEPCFWTPDMPQIYQAIVELRQAGNVVARAERIVGMRTLGATGRKLFYDGKRWVLRGAHQDTVAEAQLSAWREADTAIVSRHPDEAFCQAASRVGALIVAELDSADVGEIQRLSRWPAVGIVSLPNRAPLELGGLAHNLLLAERFAAGQPITTAPWAQVAICEIGQELDLARRAAGCSIPLIATRANDGPLEAVTAGRTRCDALQRDLAGPLDISGYIV
jgi:hypothetical protein